MLKAFNKLKKRALIAVATLVAQTTTTPASSIETAQNIANSLSQLLFPLITIIILIALPILVFKVINETILDIIRR